MRVGLREANQRFSKIIKAVREGKEVVLTDRGKPIARVTPIVKEPDIEAVLDRMAAEGFLIRATKRGPMPYRKPIKIKGGPLSDTISEERDER